MLDINRHLRLTIFPQFQGEHRKSQINFIFDGILINAAIILTSGVFLSGYIVSLQASDLLVGILNNSITWSLIISVFSFLIFERMTQRKTLLITLNVISRTLVCTTVLLPLFLQNDRLILNLTAGMIVAGNILWSIYSVGIVVWMINLLPNHIKNRYIYLRMLYLRISFTFFTLVMGWVLDWFDKSQTGFIIVFAVSFILSLADAIILSKTHEPINKVDKTVKLDAKLLLEPLKNKEYTAYLLFIFFFYVSLTLSSSYTPLFLVKYLELDYSFISVINAIAFTSMILCTHLWGRLEAQKGLKFVLFLTAVFVVSEFLLYGFLTQKSLFLLYVTPFLTGIGNSGFNVAVVTYRYNIIPENHKTIYEGWFGATIGLSALIGPTAGNLLMKLLPEVEGTLFQHSSFQFLYLISFSLGLLVVLLTFYKSPLRHLHHETPPTSQVAN